MQKVIPQKTQKSTKKHKEKIINNVMKLYILGFTHLSLLFFITVLQYFLLLYQSRFQKYCLAQCDIFQIHFQQMLWQ